MFHDIFLLIILIYILIPSIANNIYQIIDSSDDDKNDKNDQIRWNIKAVSTWNVHGMPKLFNPGLSVKTRRKYWRQWNDEMFKKVIGDIGSKKDLIICTFQEVWGNLYIKSHFERIIGDNYNPDSLLKLPYYTNFDANSDSIVGRLNSGLLTMSNWKYDVQKFYEYDACTFPDCMATKGVIFTLYSSIQSVESDGSHGSDEEVKVKSLVFNTHLDADASAALKQVSELDDFIKKMLNKYCRSLNYCEIILMGDFNIDWRSNSKITESFKNMMKTGLKMTKISNPKNVGTSFGEHDDINKYEEYDLIFVRRLKPIKKYIMKLGNRMNEWVHEDVTEMYEYIGKDVQEPIASRIESVQKRMEKDGVFSQNIDKDQTDLLSDHDWVGSILGND